MRESGSDRRPPGRHGVTLRRSRPVPSAGWVALLAAGVLAGAGLAGCDDRKRQADELSSYDYILGLQHKYWNQARQSLQSDQPNLDLLRAVERLLSGRSMRSVQSNYDRPNKKAVIASLEAIQKAFSEEISPKVDTRSPKVQLRPGVTLGQLREAFERLDKDYRPFEAMTAPPAK